MEEKLQHRKVNNLPKITQLQMGNLECEPRLTASGVSCCDHAAMLCDRYQLILTERAAIVWLMGPRNDRDRCIVKSL